MITGRLRALLFSVQAVVVGLLCGHLVSDAFKGGSIYWGAAAFVLFCINGTIFVFGEPAVPVGLLFRGIEGLDRTPKKPEPPCERHGPDFLF